MKIKNVFKFSDYKILKYSRLFDKKYYLENNKDIQDTNIDPIIHFLNYGWKEGRNPSRKFDINAYLTRYSDVKEANVNPLLHYIKYGKKEGRCIQSVETGWIDLLSNIYSLLRNNPSLISKFIFLLKSKGIKYAIRKVITKSESQMKLEEHKKTLCFDNIFPALGNANLIAIQEFYKNNEISKPIDIIIPVYNGFEFLDKLFLSIKENTSLPYRLFISDDSSPDERVVPFIENFIAENPNINITFIKNIENQGFLKTVNLLSKYVENHMVLLNTDTEVPKFWLERLMYPIFKDRNIASTTPFTNSGTICSFPNYLIDNKDIYSNLTLEQVDSIFQLVDVEKTMLEVPTGVGFCMGVNFDVVKEIGMFDEIYGKGYGEENDWCQRAINAGYKNMHITNLFVYHKHGGSFLSEDKIRYINEHYQILLSKFPSYDDQIQSTIKDNSLEGLRGLVRCIIDFKYITKENVLIIDHELGGGANLYCKQKIDSLLAQEKGVVFFSYNINKNKYFISFFTSGFSQQFNLINLDLLTKVLDFFVVNEILLNGLVSFPNVYEILSLVLKIKERKDNIKLIFPVHDYFCISPSYTLLTENNIYRGVPIDLEKHSQFLESSNSEFKLFCSETDAGKWQENWRSFLLSCDEVLCFSHSSEEIILAVYCEIKDKLVYVPHDIKGTFDNIYDEINKDGSRVIGILGNINLPKGSLVIKELVSYIDNRGLDIQIVLIGNIDIDITSNSFIKTGSYQKQDVPGLLKKYKITEFLIPSIWPETYSYTTDEIMQLGYPITVFDLGAPAERVKLYEKGRIIDINSENYIEEICKEWL
jgi:ORF12 protein|nr:glycosyltransferase [uncultured Aggregatibacter sp.]